MPAFNRAHFIGEAMASVLAQSFTDFELIVVDDGSTDGTVAAAQAVSDPRVRVVSHPQNVGRSRNRNRAIDEARGDYIVWVADDDRQAEGALQAYAEAIDAQPELDVIYGQLQLFEVENEDLEALDVFDPDDWTGRESALLGAKLHGSCIPDGGSAIRRALYDTQRYDPEFVRAQDYDLWTRLVEDLRVRKLPRIVYHYRKHPGSASFARCVDLSYESKIIRRHFTRHPLERLLPRLRGSQEHAWLALARHLLDYQDPYNAARFLEALPSSRHIPALAELWERVAILSGDLEAAPEGFVSLAAEVASAEGGEREQRVRALVEAHGPNRVASRARAEILESANRLGEALDHACMAMRLDPTDPAGIERARRLAAVAPEDPRYRIDAMLRRLLDEHVALPSPTRTVADPGAFVALPSEHAYPHHHAALMALLEAHPEAPGAWAPVSPPGELAQPPEPFGPHCFEAPPCPPWAAVWRASAAEGDHWSRCLRHGRALLQLSWPGGEAPLEAPDLQTLLEVYAGQEARTRFDRAARAAQNRALAPHRLALPRFGTAAVVLLTEADPRTRIPAQRILVSEHETLSDALVLRVRPEVALAKRLNLGLARADGEVVAVVHAPADLESGWLSRMIFQLHAAPDVGLVHGPGCVLLSRGCLERIGGLDTRLAEPWPDYRRRAALAGFRELGAEAVLEATGDFDPAVHHRPIGAEPGFRPGTTPVQLLEAPAPLVLSCPPWSPEGLQAFLRLAAAHAATFVLRVPPGEGPARVAQLESAREAAALDPGALEVRVVDAPLAPEREAGLYTAAALVYAQPEWPEADDFLRRAIDCGRPVATDPGQLRGALAER